jgi:hypothetical protein
VTAAVRASWGVWPASRDPSRNCPHREDLFLLDVNLYPLVVPATVATGIGCRMRLGSCLGVAGSLGLSLRRSSDVRNTDGCSWGRTAVATFHVEIWREGPFWQLHIVEINQSARVERRAEVDEAAVRLISSQSALVNASIELVVWTERDSVKIVAEGLGFDSRVSAEARTDLFSRGENAVWVRYDDYDCVADVHASNELTPFQPTREGAIDALEFRPGG